MAATLIKVTPADSSDYTEADAINTERKNSKIEVDGAYTFVNTYMSI